MDTEQYFCRSASDMIANYSSGCRPGTHRGTDTGWGCYSRAWWRRGMQLFVRSPKSHDVQNRAWLAQMESTVKLALEHGWTTPRSLAIATGVANSMGGKGFAILAARQRWHAEQVLSAYAGRDKHRLRRRRAIDANFPARDARIGTASCFGYRTSSSPTKMSIAPRKITVRWRAFAVGCVA